MRILLFVLTLVYFLLAVKTSKSIYFIISFALFIWWLYEYKKEQNRIDEYIEKDSIKKIETISHTSYILSIDYLRALVIDENSNMLYIAEREDVESNFEEKGYSFEEVFEVAIVEDDEMFSLISKGGVQGWSLIDGGVGKKEDEDEDEKEEVEDNFVKKLSIRLVVNDLENPLIEYVFIDDLDGIEKDSEDYEALFKECTKWHQKITVIMKRNEKVPVLNWT